MNDPLFSVSGKIVVVCGGSRGIGRGIAAGFIDRGATLVVAGREAATLETTARELTEAAVAAGVKHPVVAPLVCDVAKKADVERLAAQVLERFGRVDVLLNVAGVNRRKPAESFTEDDYDFVLDVNLKGPFLASLAFGRSMLERESGTQINIVSLNNDRPLKGVAPYAMSKSALSQMTRSLAAEWGPRGVRVNAIAPGFILTDLTKKMWSQPEMLAWGIP
ncbi:MAG: SDR family NAD(P)-dependent oxidoreductase, partial [Planctomycetia bacterium]